MLIVWGNKIVRRAGGHALHFCSVCRALRGCRVITVYRVGHVYYIPLGRGERVASELTCPECASIYGVTAPITSREDPITNLQDALDQLLPDEAAPLRHRVELEAASGDPSFPLDDRRALLAEPFLALNYEHMMKADGGRRESANAILQLAFIVNLFAAPILWMNHTDNPSDTGMLAWATGCSAAAVLLLAFLVWRAVTGRRQVASKQFLPRIAASLLPLSPRRDEIEEVLAALQARKVPLAVGIKPSVLFAAIKGTTPGDWRVMATVSPAA